MEMAVTDGQSAAVNPWLAIWRHPRNTIRYLLSTDPDRMIWVLAALGGAQGYLAQLLSMNQGPGAWPLPVVVAVACLAGAIGGILSLIIGAKLVRVIGDLLGGEGAEEHIRTALAWSSVPAVVHLLLMLVLVVAVPWIYQPVDPLRTMSAAASVGLLAALAGMLVLTAWQFVIAVAGVAEAHHYSVLRAALTLFGPLLLLFALGGVLRLMLG